MEENRLKHIKWAAAGLVLITIIIAGIYLVNSKNVEKSSGPPPDPETGITAWMSAMNDKDVSRLYDLSPLTIRSNISRQDFIRANTDNAMLKPGVVLSNPEIINKSSDGRMATIKAQIVIDSPSSGSMPVFFTFYLNFENGEWKIWTSKL